MVVGAFIVVVRASKCTIKERRVAESAARKQSVAGDARGTLPAEVRVEPFRVAWAAATSRPRPPPARRAAPPGPQPFRNVGTVRLILCLREDDLHGADD